MSAIEKQNEEIHLPERWAVLEQALITLSAETTESASSLPAPGKGRDAAKESRDGL